MENNKNTIDIPQAGQQQAPAPIAPKQDTPQYQDLSSYTVPERNQIPVPSLLDKARGAARTTGRIANTGKSVASSVVRERVSRPLSKVHAVSSRDVAETVQEKTERVASEISGFTAGATRFVGGFAAGLLGGLTTGTIQGLVAKHVKKLRARDHAPSALVQIGAWNEVSTAADGSPVLLMDLDRPIVDGEPHVRHASIPLDQAVKEDITLVPGQPPVACVCVPVVRGNTVAGLIVAAQNDAHTVYSFIEE
jgi:hypothetical protein